MESSLFLLVVLLLVVGASAAVGNDDMATRRLQIAKMTPAEQQELLRRQERFATLPPEEQQRLRALQAALDADPHAQQLEHVLKHYHEWLKSLSPTQRAELADLGPADRVAQIKHIKQQQEFAREQARRAELLSPKDSQEIVHWAQDVLWAHRERFLAQMPSSRRESFEHLELPRQRQALLYFAFERGRRGGSGGGGMAAMQQKDIDRLAAKLSPAAKEALTEAPDLVAQRRIVVGWIGSAMHRSEPRQMNRKLPPWVDDELVQFFQNELKPFERERLLKMPREQMVEEIRKLYFDRERPDADKPSATGAPGRLRDAPAGDRHRGPRRNGGPAAATEDASKPEPAATP